VVSLTGYEPYDRAKAGLLAELLPAVAAGLAKVGRSPGAQEKIGVAFAGHSHLGDSGKGIPLLRPEGALVAILQRHETRALAYLPRHLTTLPKWSGR
jgi:hypothetical protein